MQKSDGFRCGGIKWGEWMGFFENRGRSLLCLRASGLKGYLVGLEKIKYKGTREEKKFKGFGKRSPSYEHGRNKSNRKY